MSRFVTLLTVFVALVAIAAIGLRKYNLGCYCDENVDLTGKIVVITGGHSGIGYETTKGLAIRGATVFVGCKDVTKCQEAVNTISEETKNNKIKVIELDLGSLESVRRFSSAFKKENLNINILINNAGTWMGDHVVKSVDGFEMTFAVNHLGHFLLTNLLLDQIKGGKARVVTVSSGLHMRGVVEFDNLNSEKNFTAFQAYSNSKLMNVLFSNELARRLEGTGVSTSSLHPGVITTNLHRSLSNPVLAFLYTHVWGFLGKSVEYGAQTTITAAISKSLDGKTGVYLKECAVEEPIPTAKDEALAKRLWEVSEKLVKLN